MDLKQKIENKIQCVEERPTIENHSLHNFHPITNYFEYKHILSN
jgi:hypothetical protein